MNAAFWKDRRVFITGHTGFKGSWLALWLTRAGANVCGYALPPESEPNLYSSARVDELIEAHTGDVRDIAALESVMQRFRPEIVLHMAAQSLVRRSYADPVFTYATNVMGTVNVLDASRRIADTKAVIVVTTDKCYENQEWPWGYRENERLGGHDPYSNSKACAELVTSAYRNSFFNAPGAPRIASARAGNVIGGGDWAQDRLLPDAVRAFAVDRAVLIRNPNAIRPWQHVLEPLSGYLSLGERLLREDGAAFAKAWNFGPRDDDARPVAEVVRTAASLWGEPARVAIDKGPHPHEAHFLKLDCSLARQELRWQPRLDLDTALGWTIEWYREALRDPAISRQITQTQIERYEGLSA